MLAGLAFLAAAATLTVGDDDDYRTITEAVAASAPGDQIVIAPGVYAEELELPHVLSLEGTGASAGDTVLLNPRGSMLMRSASSLSLTNLTLDGGGRGGLLEVVAPATSVVLTDLELHSAGPYADTPTAVVLDVSDAVQLDHVRVSDLFIDGVFVDTRTTTVHGSTFERIDGVALTTHDTVTLTDCTFASNSGRGLVLRELVRSSVRIEGSHFEGNAGALFIDLNGFYGGEIAVIGNQFLDNHAEVAGGAIDLSEPSFFGDVRIIGNVFAGNSAGSLGGAVRINDPYYFSDYYDYVGYDRTSIEVTLARNTFVENAAPSGAHLRCRDDIALHMANNLFVGAQEGSGISSERPPRRSGYNLYFANALGDLERGVPSATAVFADPLFVDWSADGNPLNDDFRLAPDSPAIDAGLPAFLDPDGSRSDLGAL